jgi:hypothetical protein
MEPKMIKCGNAEKKMQELISSLDVSFVCDPGGNGSP